MQKIKIGVIGFGHLGYFHAQKYAQHPCADLIAVCDIDAEKCRQAEQQFHVKTSQNYQDVLDEVDAVSIVVPAHLHYDIAQICLSYPVHVLLEKPITTDNGQAQHLIQATPAQTVFQIGHLERFNPVLKPILKSPEIPFYIETQRLAPAHDRGKDVSVILDLMIHDLDLIHQLIPFPITHLHAQGAHYINGSLDVASAWINFKNGTSAHLTVNRISPETKRQFSVYYHDHYKIANLQEKVLYHSQFRPQSGSAPPTHPIITTQQHFEKDDALYEEISAFLNAISEQTPPIVTAYDAQQALQTALWITDSICHSDKG